MQKIYRKKLGLKSPKSFLQLWKDFFPKKNITKSPIEGDLFDKKSLTFKLTKSICNTVDANQKSGWLSFEGVSKLLPLLVFPWFFLAYPN